MSKIGDQGSGIGDRDRDRLDTAIDLAVREMLEVEPPSDLRARVLARIDPGSVASAFPSNSVVSAFRRKVLWVPLAAAAILILAVLLPSKPTPRDVSPVTTVATRQPQPAASTAPSTGAPVTPQAADAGGTRLPARMGPTVRAAVAADDASADVVWVTPLAGPAAMSVTPIEAPPEPVIQSIELAPAEIPALEVRPISDTPRGGAKQE